LNQLNPGICIEMFHLALSTYAHYVQNKRNRTGQHSQWCLSSPISSRRRCEWVISRYTVLFKTTGQLCRLHKDTNPPDAFSV